MCFYYYTVTAYNESYNEYTETGYTVGTSYQHAMNHLTEYFGEDEIIKVTLEYVADKPILVLPNDNAIAEKGLITAIKENNNI